MGKITEGTLPKNHKIFTGSWSINTEKKQTKSTKDTQKSMDGKKETNPKFGLLQ